MVAEITNNLRGVRSKHRVAMLLVAQIDAGIYAVGDQLPPLRDLCSEFGVAIDTARDAVRLLQREGRVQVRARKGVFVVDPVTPLPPEDELKQVYVELRDLQARLRDARRALAGLEERLAGLADRLSAVD